MNEIHALLIHGRSILKGCDPDIHFGARVCGIFLGCMGLVWDGSGRHMLGLSCQGNQENPENHLLWGADSCVPAVS